MYTILPEWAAFYRRCDKNILVCFVFFRFTVPIIAVHLQNANAKFHKVVETLFRYGKVEKFTSLYGKFSQDNTHRILFGSAGFRGRYDKKFLAFFRFTVYFTILIVDSTSSGRCKFVSIYH